MRTEPSISFRTQLGLWGRKKGVSGPNSISSHKTSRGDKSLDWGEVAWLYAYLYVGVFDGGYVILPEVAFNESED